MPQDAPARSKPGDMYAKMHLGLDHVLGKLLLDAPPLPASLTLQTETQTLGTTWVQVTEAFEKRRAMLQRRKEKEKTKKPAKKDNKPKEKVKTKQKSRRSSSSETARSPPRVKTEKKSRKKTASPRVLKLPSEPPVKTEEPGPYEASVLKKLRKQPMCENVTFGSNKYKALVKWMEVDKGKNAGTSAELMQLLTQLELDDATEKKKNNPKLSRKRSLESLDDALRSEKRDKRKSGDRRRSEKKKALYVDEDEVVYESGEEEDEPEYDGGYSDSDEAEFVPELNNSPPPEKPKKRTVGRPPKKQKQVKKEKETVTSDARMTSKEALAAVVAKIRADEAASGTSDPKYLSYEKPKTAKPGASPTSAIVLDDSEEEDEEEASSEEEETKSAQEHDSSTDDDNGLFDLNEEDVYVVEAILCVKEGRTLLSAGGQKNKDADLYLVKWDGYNELTWEPEENIPQLLIGMFRERERAKRKCGYQIKTAHERREVINVTTQTKEIIYLIQWINQETAVWESRVTLPTQTQVWLDKVLGGGRVITTKKRRETKAAKQFFYQ